MIALELAQAGLKETGDWLESSAKQFRLDQRRNVRRATNVLRNAVRRKASSTFKDKTGVLRGSIASKVTVKSGGYEVEGRVFIRKRYYYAILETGGEIRAKKQPYLVFGIGDGLVRRKVLVIKERVVKGKLRKTRYRSSESSGGEIVRVKKVTIGRHPFFDLAFTEKRDEALEIVGRSFDVFKASRFAA